MEYFDREIFVTGSLYEGYIKKKCVKKIRKKRRHKLTKIVLLHQYNVSAHGLAVAVAVTQDADFEVLKHPTNAPDLAPGDLFLFPRLKEHPKGQRLEDDEAMAVAVQEFLDSQDKKFFKKGISSAWWPTLPPSLHILSPSAPVPHHEPTPYPTRYPIPVSQAGKALVTPPVSRLSMAGDDHLCSAGSHARLPFDYAIKPSALMKGLSHSALL
ncbi:Histone-lysine N-methyltransferase SETMAR [Eumeta japonica]|uniref:Histone-lysine N-methyltransferase SETMAR n=1 Tax=Eumeta variegata TaxID=151549 RepID=A0A4C1X5X5_EUMVA|nr:Histone-lysine N-methyltransferase SETMAR [Eumeta japonica]